MGMRRELAILSTLMVLVQSPVYAQQVIPPGMFSIGGIPVVCGNVQTVIVAGLGDMGRATPVTPYQAATIWLDVAFFSMPLEVQFFIYGHECAHHQPMVGSNERLADCWAAQVGKRQGWFGNTSMRYLTMQFAWNPGDWTHAPGPVRLSNILACYESA